MDVSKNRGYSPQIIHFQRGFPLFKPSMLGEHPYFWKDPDADFALLSFLCQHVFLGNGSKKTPFHHCKELYQSYEIRSWGGVTQDFWSQFWGNILSCVETKFHWNTPIFYFNDYRTSLTDSFFFSEKKNDQLNFGRIGVFSTSSLPVPFFDHQKNWPQKRATVGRVPEADHLWGLRLQGCFCVWNFGVWKTSHEEGRLT